MILFELTRDPPQNLPCTLGVLRVAGHKFQTIERPWIPHPDGGLGGKNFESCVPPGFYRLERWVRPSGEKVLMLRNQELDVYGLPAEIPTARKGKARDLVLMHVANYVHDVVGCIGPGLERVHDGREWMVTRSRDAMIAIRALVGNDTDLKLRIEAQ